MDRALGECVEPDQQRAGVASPAEVPEGLRAPAAAPDFAPSLAAADPLVRARAVDRLQRSTGDAAVPASAPAASDGAQDRDGGEGDRRPRRGAAATGGRVKRGAQAKLDSIGSYFAGVNGAYTR